MGYHYETLSESHGDYNEAIELFQEGINKFKSLGISVKTISMHGSPLSKYNNQDLWNEFNYLDYGIIGDAYKDVDFDKYYYFTDTGRNYSGNTGNIKDRPKGSYIKIDYVQNTFDLINFIREEEHPIYLTIHPDKWSISSLGTIKEMLIVSTKNIVKNLLVKNLRNYQ